METVVFPNQYAVYPVSIQDLEQRVQRLSGARLAARHRLQRSERRCPAMNGSEASRAQERRGAYGTTGPGRTTIWRTTFLTPAVVRIQTVPRWPVVSVPTTGHRRVRRSSPSVGSSALASLAVTGRRSGLRRKARPASPPTCHIEICRSCTPAPLRGTAPDGADKASEARAMSLRSPHLPLGLPVLPIALTRTPNHGDSLD